MLGRFTAQFGVPALLFRAISRQPLGAVLNGDYLAVYAAGSLTALFIVTLVAWRLRERPVSLAALQGLGASGSNSAFIGYPIVLQVIGPTAGVALALCTLVENLLVMPLALALADSGGGGQRPGAVLRSTLRSLVRNPMILAIFSGLTVSALGWHIPAVLDQTVSLAAAAAPPTALFVIGGSLVGLQLAGIRGDIALITCGKLLLHPPCVLAFVLLFPPEQPLLRATSHSLCSHADAEYLSGAGTAAWPRAPVRSSLAGCNRILVCFHQFVDCFSASRMATGWLDTFAQLFVKVSDMKKTMNWGVLGAAAIATGRTMPALLEAPSATLLALASRDLEKGRTVAKTFGIERLYGTYDALLADPDIDVVYVPLPNQLHFEWAMKALEADKNVLCEKPLCMTAAQVATLCEVRDRTGKHIEEGFGFRNHPQWFENWMSCWLRGPLAMCVPCTPRWPNSFLIQPIPATTRQPVVGRCMT